MANALRYRERKDSKAALQNDLRQSIARIEGRFSGFVATSHGADAARQETCRAQLGIREIDRALDPANGKGIIANALHEVRVETGLAAASGAGFGMALGLTVARTVTGTVTGTAARAVKEAAAQEAAVIPPVFWISDLHTRSEYGSFYGPGLGVFRLRADDLIRIHPRSPEELLWAAGEIAATPNAAAFCLVEITQHPKKVDMTATRRLMLRAQASGTPVILLRQSGHEEASAASTRWCVRPACSSQKSAGFNTAATRPLRDRFIGPPAFAVALEKCRGGYANSSTHWIIEWNRDEQRFTPILSASDISAGCAGSHHNPDHAGKSVGLRQAPISLDPSAKTRHGQDHAAKTG